MAWSSARPDGRADEATLPLPRGAGSRPGGALAARVSSYGDRLPRGTFNVHSRFRRCVNFLAPDGLVSVVDESVGAGPFHIVLTATTDTLEPPSLPQRSLTVTDSVVIIDGELFALDPAARHDSSFTPPEGASIERLWAGAGRLEEMVLREAPSASLAYLLALDQPARRLTLQSSFERAFAERMIEVISLVRAGLVEEAASRANGAGIGLTPSGDDLCCGLLIASHLVEAVGGAARRDLLSDREKIGRAALGVSPFSNTFLRAAARGWFNVPVRDVARALCADDAPALEAAALRLFEQGETSGADTAVGMVVGIKFWLGV